MSRIEPVLPLVVFVLLAAVWALPRWRSGARKLAAAAALLLFLWSWPPVVFLTSATLERWYPYVVPEAAEAGAIVVLSAGLVTPDSSLPFAVADIDTQIRTRYAAWLYRRWGRLPVVVSGGPLGPPGRKVVVAELMRGLLLAEGVDPADIWVEGRSLTTYQNALYSAELLRARGVRRIVLITQGYHMPRAVACFRKQGLDVVPAPCALRSLEFPSRFEDFLPSATAVLANEDALHEWIGLVWYWVSGRI